MRTFRLFRWFKQLLVGREPEIVSSAPAPTPVPAAPQQPPLTESLGDLNEAMRSLDQEMLRLAQAWQSLGASLESLKQQKSRNEVEVSVFGRIDNSRLN